LGAWFRPEAIKTSQLPNIIIALRAWKFELAKNTKRCFITRICKSMVDIMYSFDSASYPEENGRSIAKKRTKKIRSKGQVKKTLQEKRNILYILGLFTQ